MTIIRGTCQSRGIKPKFKHKVGFFYMVLDFFIVFKHVNGEFWPLLGDIGLFLSPDFGRKLGKDNQLQIYIN